LQGQVNLGGECFDNVVITLGKSAINPQKKQYLGDILLIDGAFNLKTENIEKTKLLEKWLFDGVKDISDSHRKVTIEEARVRAFLRMLRNGEGTDGEIGYETLFGGESFLKDYKKDWSDHPHIKVKRGKLKSSAAGAYQVMGYTWDDDKMVEYRKKYFINDFSPKSQDLFAVVLLKYKRQGGLTLIKNGKIEEALDKYYSYEWASLPPPRYGQPVNDLPKCLSLFERYLEEEKKGISPLHLQKGFLENFN